MKRKRIGSVKKLNIFLTIFFFLNNLAKIFQKDLLTKIQELEKQTTDLNSSIKKAHSDHRNLENEKVIVFKQIAFGTERTEIS